MKEKIKVPRCSRPWELLSLQRGGRIAFRRRARTTYRKRKVSAGVQRARAAGALLNPSAVFQWSLPRPPHVSPTIWLRHRPLRHLRDRPRRFDRPSGSVCRRSAQNKVHSRTWLAKFTDAWLGRVAARGHESGVARELHRQHGPSILPQFPKSSLFFLWLRTDSRFLGL